MSLVLQKGIKATSYPCFCDKGGGGNKATICPCFAIKGGSKAKICPWFFYKRG